MSLNNLQSVIADTVARLHQDANDGKALSRKVVEDLKKSGWRQNDTTAPSVLNLIRFLRHAGEKVGAQAILSKALVVYPDQAEFFNEQGRLCSESKKYDQAVESFQKTIEKNPQAAAALHLEALIGAGEALRNLYRSDEAVEMFQKAFAAPGGAASAALLVQQGWLCFYQESYADAYEHFEKAIQLAGPEKHVARVGLLASCRHLPENQHTARQLVSNWLKAGESWDEIVSIFVECSESVLERLNLYPAALDNAEHLLEIANGSQRDIFFNRTLALQHAIYFKIGALKWLRRYARAEKTFHEAPAVVRTSTKVWNEFANCFYEQKRFAEAYRHYHGEAANDANLTDEEKRQLKEDLKKDREAREWSIVCLRKMREFKKARVEVNLARLEFNGEINFVSESAAIYYAQRDYDKAIEHFGLALELNDHDEFALQWHAASLRKKGDLTEAKKFLDEALTKVPSSTRLWEERGWLAYDQGNFEDANSAFDKAIAIDSYVIHKHFAKVETLLRLNRSGEALQVFKNLQQQFPNDAEVAEQLCWYYIRMGELELAEEQQIRLRQSHPNNILGLNAKGGCELALKQYKEAERAFRLAISKVKYEPQYYVNLAFALIRQVPSTNRSSNMDDATKKKLSNKARRQCHTALALDPVNAKAYECLGLIAFKEDLLLDAEFYFRKSIEVNPKEESSYVQLGSLYSRKGCYDKATEMIQKALALNARESRAYIELASIAASKGDCKEAIRYCREAVFVQPKYLGTHRALAIALMSADRYEEAELVVRKAVRALAPLKPWRLYLLLAQILVHLADKANKDRKQKDLEPYKEALGYVDQARQAKGPTAVAATYFHLGIVHYRLEDFDLSKKSFAECLKLDSGRFEAERNRRIVETAIKQQRKRLDFNEKFSYGLAAICLAILFGLWGAYFLGHKRTVPIDSSSTQAAGANSPTARDQVTVDQTFLQVMTPLLLGLFTIAALLPNLSKLKLPGFEAEIAAPTPTEPDISTGPRGEIGFGSSLSVIDPQPR